MNTGSRAFDEFLSGYGCEITCIYGPAATGKTTLATLAAVWQAKCGNRALFIDTENGFSSIRAKQLGADETALEKIIVLKINCLKEQNTIIQKLPEISSKFSVIIIDTICFHYRNERSREATEQLAAQLKILQSISQNKPVIITNQVFSDETGNHQTGEKLIEPVASKIIELNQLQNIRFAVMHRPERKKTEFKITENAIQ